MNLASMIDHTILKMDCRIEDVKKLCDEAIQFKFAAVCIPPYFVKEAARHLEYSRVKVATVIGFPYGYATTSAKVEEVKRAINDDVDEVDAVINVCAVKEARWNYVKNDIESMTLAAHLKGKVIKVILETALLSKEEIIKLCTICNDLEVNYVKTSTGVNGQGATKEIVELLRANLSKGVKIKASGGIRNLEQAQALIDAGATRIGTSAGTSIVGQVEEV